MFAQRELGTVSWVHGIRRGSAPSIAVPDGTDEPEASLTARLLNRPGIHGGSGLRG